MSEVHWINTHPESPVHNSQEEGIGRIEAFGSTVFINNLGKNIEMSRFENGALNLRGMHCETLFPNQDELSQFDLDMHAFLITPDGGKLLALNHQGLVRVFDTASLRPVQAFYWYGDVERTVLLNGCLVGSSPNGYETDDPERNGIVLGKPYSFALEHWGKITAIQSAETGDKLTVAAGPRLGLFSLHQIGGAIQIDKLLWQLELPFSVLWIKPAPSEQQWIVAGDRFGARIDAAGQCLSQFQFDIDLAWGNGAVPLAMNGDLLVGADRLAGIYAWQLHSSSITKTILREPDAAQSLGMAHLAICKDHVLGGYNRGGYRLLCVRLAA